MQSDEAGVSRKLRNILFPISRQIKRRGKRRDRSTAEEGIGDAPLGNKQVQRQSKQKERCENKLMSLLFATVYDYSSKRCRLAGDVPPLKLVKIDKKGQSRNVSNYTEVRAYLRYAMGVILASHTNAMKILSEMLPSVFGSQSSLFMLMARTFVVILLMERSSESEDRQFSDLENFQAYHLKMAYEILDVTFDSIQEYLTEWGDRNYSRKKKLRNCRNAGKNNECYKANFNLLKAMIGLVPPYPNYPEGGRDRQHCLFEFALTHEGKCTLPSGECILERFCPGTVRVDDTELDRCHEVVDSLCFFVEMVTSFPVSDAFSEMQRSEFPTAIWKSLISDIDLHRLKDMSHRLRSEAEGPKPPNGMRHVFIAQVKFCVVQGWAALIRSCAENINMMKSLGQLKQSVMRETAMELVFGGGIAAAALFENDMQIQSIAERLRGRKGMPLTGIMLPAVDGDGSGAGFADEEVHTPTEQVLVVVDSGRNDTSDHGVRITEEREKDRQMPEDDEREDDRDGEEVDEQEEHRDRQQSTLPSPERRTEKTVKRAVLRPTRKKPNKTSLRGKVNNEVSDLDSDNSVITGSPRGGRGMKTPVATARKTIRETEESEGGAEEEEQPVARKRKAPTRAQRRKKRRGTITRTIEEAKVPAGTVKRSRKRTRRQ